MCPTVCIGRSSSVVVAPVACRARLHISVTSIGFAFFEFARKSVSWEAVGDDLNQSAFVFRSFARGF